MEALGISNNGNLCLAKRSCAMEAGGGAQLFLDAEKLIVLGDGVGAAGGAGFDLAGGRSHGEIGDESVFGLAGSMGNDGIVAGFKREPDGVNCFRYGSALFRPYWDG